jgi:hypothetical protein
MSGSNDILVTDTLTNVVFDGSQLYNNNASIPVTLTGTFVAEYSPDGTLIGIEDVSLVASTTLSGYDSSTLTSAYITNAGTPGATGTAGLNQINVNNNGGGGSFNNAYLDFTGETPTSLDSGLNSSVGNPSGLEYLNGGAASSDGVITSTVNFGGDTYVETTYNNTVFDGNGEAVTLNGSMLTEYNAGGTLIGVSNVTLVADDPSDTGSYPSTLTNAVINIAGTPGASGSAGINEIEVTTTGGSFQHVNLDFFGETPSQLQDDPVADDGHYSSIGYPTGTEPLYGSGAGEGTIGSGTDVVQDTLIFTTIANVVFDSNSDPVTISGTFEADYNPGGTLVGVSNIDIVESGAATGTFTSLGALTAGDPTAGGQASLNQLTFYGPDSLYLDYYGELPSSVFSGSYGDEYSSVYVGGNYEQIGDGGNAGNFADEQTPACFAAGTRILTETGEIPVESLRTGDQLVLAEDGLAGGGTAPVIWIGRRTLDLARHPNPETVQPILIAPGALADSVPARKLIVSPDHALAIDGLLIPAKILVNGVSIVQLNLRSVTYFHIELPRHAVLFAEGTPAESYLETGNRGAFEDSGDALILHPDFAQTAREKNSCAPFAEQGDQVEAIRATILRRANICLSQNPALRIEFSAGAAIIRSRTAIPGQISPDPRDRRRLGVKIAGLTIAGAAIPLDHPDLAEGWHDIEPDGRWTNGAATIPASLLNGQTDLHVEIAATPGYLIAAA